jgi:integrase
MNATSTRSALTTAKRTVSRGRLPNTTYRVREYLTEKEVERLIKAAGNNRWGHRDATMILIAYRHGLRASELCGLRWDQVDVAHGRLHVSRAKNGVASVHPLAGVELRALRRLQREQEDSRYVFLSERGAPMGPPWLPPYGWPPRRSRKLSPDVKDAALLHAPTAAHIGF